jgi:hypothetical protein
MSVVRSLNDVPGDPSKSQQSLTSNQHQPDHHVQEIVVCPLLLMCPLLLHPPSRCRRESHECEKGKPSLNRDSPIFFASQLLLTRSWPIQSRQNQTTLG